MAQTAFVPLLREIGIDPNKYLTVCLFDPTRSEITKEINPKLPPYRSYLPTCHHCSLALGERGGGGGATYTLFIYQLGRLQDFTITSKLKRLVG